MKRYTQHNTHYVVYIKKQTYFHDLTIGDISFW